MASKKYNLEEVEELWHQEPDDNKVFRTATEDTEEYPPEVQAVIKEEAKRRREAKTQRNTIPKQKKVKVYRVLVGILSICGMCGSLSYALQCVLQEGIIVLSYAAVVDTLFGFVINIFLWAGLILLWRADKNEYPVRKSNWLNSIRVYVILSLTIIIAMLVFPIIVKMVRQTEFWRF